MEDMVQCMVAPRVEDWIPVMVDSEQPPMACHAGKLEFEHTRQRVYR